MINICLLTLFLPQVGWLRIHPSPLIYRPELCTDCPPRRRHIYPGLVWSHLSREGLVWSYLSREGWVWSYLLKESLVWSYLSKGGLVWSYLLKKDLV